MWWLCDESIKALKRLAFVQPTGRAEGSGGRLEKWGSLCEISLGNPSDARPHYGCGYSMKESPLSGLPVLISSTQAKASSSPSFIPHLCAGGPLLTQKQSHSLACIPWPGLWAGLPSCEDKCICVGVCCLCVQVCVCVCAHTYPGRLNSHWRKPFCQLQHILPFTDGSQIQNGWSYFKPLILKMVTHNTEIVAVDSQTWGETSAQCSVQISVFLC